VSKRNLYIVVAIIIAIAIGGFALYQMLRPELLAPDLTINPDPSPNDEGKPTVKTLYGGNSLPLRIGDSIDGVSFATNGESLSLFGNFTVAGDGDGSIDFFIITDRGFTDLHDGDGIISNEYIFNQTLNTKGFYWGYVLPSYFNGYSVSHWHILYSAYTKSGILVIEYRNVNGIAYKDNTAPKWYSNLPVTIENELNVSLWAWDDRCNIAQVTVRANGSEIYSWSGNGIGFYDIVFWNTTLIDSGVYILTIYLEDEVGNGDIFEMGQIRVFHPTPEQEIGRNISIVLGFVSIVVTFVVIVSVIRNTVIDATRSAISIIVIVGTLTEIFGPLDFLSLIAGICGILSFLHILYGTIQRRRIQKRLTPKHKPTYYH
jgi:hypothetical protein